MIPEQNKSLTNNSDDGSDQNPHKGKLEQTHKLQERKRQSTQQEVEKLVPEDEVVLQDMDLDVDIENI